MGSYRFDPRVIQDGQVIRFDRTALNTLEQMPVFLVTMWLYAVLVDAEWAGIGGLIYVITRSRKNTIFFL